MAGKIRPSPAMVVACIALATALGGTSYAAVTLAPNSVGTVHLRNNAVISSKVRNGSLLRADFKAGQIPAGKAGPQGPTGPTGPAGAKGDKGDAGAAATKLWATVGADGMLVSGSGVTSTSRTSPGHYLVKFDTAINQCVAAGTLALGPFGGAPPVGVMAGLAGANDTAAVQVRDVTGGFKNHPFMLTVFC